MNSFRRPFLSTYSSNTKAHKTIALSGGRLVWDQSKTRKLSLSNRFIPYLHHILPASITNFSNNHAAEKAQLWHNLHQIKQTSAMHTIPARGSDGFITKLSDKSNQDGVSSQRSSESIRFNEIKTDKCKEQKVSHDNSNPFNRTLNWRTPPKSPK